MSTKLLICDDSKVARKQLARSLPEDWDVDISFASNGVEGIAAIKSGKSDVLLLDLNMPKMDGYQVLTKIISEDLPTLTVVVSGDSQPEAHKRVKKLGAIDFLKKPVSKEILTDVLISYGLYTKESKNITQTLSDTKNRKHQSSEQVSSTSQEINSVTLKVTDVDTLKVVSDGQLTLPTELRDCYQEVANIAMGRAGDLLARLLNVFVQLPIPNVNFIEMSDLKMALKAVETSENTSGICQGFISSGIAGEALLILNDSSFKDIASLMNYQYDEEDSTELELLMDLGNVLIGACLQGLSEQLDISFSQGHPVVLGQHRKISELITHHTQWKKTLAIEISYNIENYPIKCDLLLLFTEKSMQTLNNKLSYLLD
jgi:chemotaxis protein CheY-P-specific phosphatase CheC/DNA-binding NarL/FixJ family response regulator